MTSQASPDSAIVGALKHFAAGYTSGFFGKLVEYPFDTVKVLQQTQGSQYKNAVDCFVQTVRARGFLGMYRGLLTPLLGAMAENATLFVSYGAMKQAMGLDKLPEQDVPMWKLGVCGAGSGVAVSFVLTPVELIKVKLQTQQGTDARFNAVRYSGPLECIQDVLRKEGVRGMWKGNLATTLREVPGNIAWFGVYEAICKLYMKPGQTKKDLQFWHFLSAGAASGVAYWSAFYPADTVKSKLQSDPLYATENFASGFRRIVAEEGPRGLYRGWGITAARAAPSHALIFAVYETVSDLLKGV